MMMLCSKQIHLTILLNFIDVYLYVSYCFVQQSTFCC